MNDPTGLDPTEMFKERLRRWREKTLAGGHGEHCATQTVVLMSDMLEELIETIEHYGPELFNELWTIQNDVVAWHVTQCVLLAPTTTTTH